MPKKLKAKGARTKAKARAKPEKSAGKIGDENARKAREENRTGGA